MSGGEQQMLAMARALMMRPKMMMLDEPSLGLSPRFVDDVFDRIVELTRDGLTVMLVEQNAARALEISDRGYVLELGRNRFEGAGRALLENPEAGGLFPEATRRCTGRVATSPPPRASGAGPRAQARARPESG
jgi:ABC-type branched-subunit amino acid transport system ATPase component